MFDSDGHMLFGGGFMWLFWILSIAAIVLGLKFISGNNDESVSSKADESPLSILKKRYARGEIDDEEYEHRVRELEK